MTLLERRLQAGIYYDKPADKGAGGDSSDRAGGKTDSEGNSASTKDTQLSIMEAVRETSNKMPGSKAASGNKHLGYGFEDDDESAGDSPAAEGRDADEGGDVSQPDKKKFFSPTEDLSDDADEGGEPEASDPEGDEPDRKDDSSAAETPDGDEPEAFYDPEVHAESDQVYPNTYMNRQDAEYAIAAKIDKYNEIVNNIEELGDDIGAVVPASVKEKISKYQDDVTQLAPLSDDDVRQLIVDLDLSIKAGSEKHQRVERRNRQQSKLKQNNQQLQQAQKQANKFVTEIGLDREVATMDPNSTFDDVVNKADQLIEAELKPLADAISEHESDDKFIEEKGAPAWRARLKELEGEYDQRRAELKEGRKALVDWQAAKDKADKLQSSDQKMTQREYLEASDNQFERWVEDRSTGPYALDILTAPTTEGVKYLKKYAYSPKNIKKYDYTTLEGWDKIHDDFQAEMQDRFSAQKKKEMTAGESRKKRQSSVDDEIPPPDPTKNQPPVNSPVDEIRRLEKDIRDNSRTMFRG